MTIEICLETKPPTQNCSSYEKAARLDEIFADLNKHSIKIIKSESPKFKQSKSSNCVIGSRKFSCQTVRKSVKLYESSKEMVQNENVYTFAPTLLSKFSKASQAAKNKVQCRSTNMTPLKRDEARTYRESNSYAMKQKIKIDVHKRINPLSIISKSFHNTYSDSQSICSRNTVGSPVKIYKEKPKYKYSNRIRQVSINLNGI